MEKESSDKPAMSSKKLGKVEMTGQKDSGLIVFDFDGTITTKDTFALFLRYHAGFWGWLKNIIFLLPTFISYKLGRIDRHRVKAAVVKRFFTNSSVAEVDAKAKRFAQTVIPGLVRPKALACFKEKMAEGDHVYICSASISPYLLHWAEAQGFPEKNVLAVELSQNSGLFSGEIDGYNVWGPNKIRRLNDALRSGNIHIAEAYGDSEGDGELLNAAKVSFYRPFRV